jgi:NAD(P)-dependent dehydrogenase (short-subunit alcohol dehydrogenase family)
MQEMKEFILRRVLLKRAGMRQNIANVALFLASEQANWIPGSDFPVDGSESACRIPESTEVTSNVFITLEILVT